MRLIGHVANETHARTFANYLYVQGIDNQLEFQKDDGWGVWIMDEDKLARASQLLATFQADPSNSAFQAQAKGAADLRAQQEKEEAAWRKRLVGRRQLFRPLTAYGFGPLTFVLIVLSIVVFFLSGYGGNKQAMMLFFITSFSETGNLIEWTRGLPEIRHGEVWRLVTPIFLHFGPIHILFNMLWLRDLGSMIEGRQSPLHLALLVLGIGIGSNLAQYQFGHGPDFGGMSGVVYGLFGYIWLRGKRDPGSGLFLHPSTVTMMLVWLVVCFTGLIGAIANAAHVAGLILGAAWGYLSSLRRS